MARDSSRLDEALRDGALQADITSAASLDELAARLGEVEMLVFATGMDVRKDLLAHTPEEIAPRSTWICADRSWRRAHFSRPSRRAGPSRSSAASPTAGSRCPTTPSTWRRAPGSRRSASR